MFVVYLYVVVARIQLNLWHAMSGKHRDSLKVNIGQNSKQITVLDECLSAWVSVCELIYRVQCVSACQRNEWRF